MKKLIIIAILTSVVTLCFAQTKTEADNMYKQEKYEAAAKAYEAILSKDGVSADIYYNLGNCYYKLENVPQSIINYERALLLDPGDDDIRTNLALARGKTTDKVTPPSEMFFVTWWHYVANSMSVNAWSTFAIIMFVLMLVGLLVYMFMGELLYRKIGIYSAMVMFVLVIIANFAGYSQNQSIGNHNNAIIITPAVSVKSSPNESSTDLFVIHEGSKVQILDASMKNWREVKFEEGKQGWVPLESIEII